MKTGISFVIHKVRAFLSVLTFPHNFVIKFYGEGLSLDARYEVKLGQGSGMDLNQAVQINESQYYSSQ